jgi:hypothetical protein
MSKKGKIILFSGIFLLLLGITWIIFRFFIHSPETELKVIPRYAAAVLKIDVQALAIKADPMKLMNDPAFKNVPGNGKSSLRKLISDPFATGIDPLADVYGFVAKEDAATVAAVVFKIRDAGDFEKFERALGIDGSLEVESGIYYSEIDKSRCIAWNSDAGLIMSVMNGDDKKTIARKYLDHDKAESLLANEDYKTFAGKKSDMGVYFSNAELAKLNNGSPFFTNGFSSGHGELLLNFENDRIATTFTNYPAVKSNTVVLKKTGPLPSQFEAVAPARPLLYFGISADMNSVLNSVSNDPAFKDYLKSAEAMLGLKDDETRKMFTGDLSLAFTDYKDISLYDPRVGAEIDKTIKESGGNLSREMFTLNSPMAYINAGVTDEERMNSILHDLGFEKVENFYAMPGIDFVLYAVAKNGHLLITNDYYAAEELAANGKFKTVLPDEISKTDALSMWTDLNQQHFPVALMETMRNDYNDATVDFFLRLIKPFHDIRMKNNGDSAEITVPVDPGQGNSLYRLITYYANLAN